LKNRLTFWSQTLLLGILLQLSSHTPALALSATKALIYENGPATKVVLDVTAKPQDLVVSDRPGRPMTVSFRGGTAGQFKSVNQKLSWPNLNGVYVASHKGKIQIFIKRNVVGTASVVATDQKVVITVPHSKFSAAHKPDTASGAIASSSPVPTATVASAQPVGPDAPSGVLANGIRHWHFSTHSAAGPIQVNVLEVDPKNPAVEILPALASNRMGAKANVARMVSNSQAVAGINGSFFKPDVGIPLGVLIINQELISGPIHDRVALGITPTNELVMDRVRLAGEVLLPAGHRLPVHNINQPRVKTGQTVVYSSRWGAMAPKVPVGGYQVQLRNGHVTAVSSAAPLTIPRDGVVISGPGTAEMQELANQPAGRNVQLNIYTLPDWSGMKHAIGGGPWLVKDGRPYVDMHAQSFSGRSLGYREPRSAVGITPDGKLLLVAVDGRRRGVSVGMTLNELAGLMRKLGAVQAMNLDGGSSTQMAVYGKTVNLPSAGNVGVSNALVVKTTNGGSVARQD
jgi:hypothetical protein